MGYPWEDDGSLSMGSIFGSGVMGNTENKIFIEGDLLGVQEIPDTENTEISIKPFRGAKEVYITNKPAVFWEKYIDIGIYFEYQKNRDILEITDGTLRIVSFSKIKKMIGDKSLSTKEETEALIAIPSAVKEELLLFYKKLYKIKKFGKAGSLRKLCTKDETSGVKSVFHSYEESKKKFKFIKDYVPAYIREAVDRYIAVIEKGGMSNSEKNNLKRCVSYLVNIDWIPELKEFSVEDIREDLDKVLVGSDYAKDALCREADAFIARGTGKASPSIILNGPEGSGKTELAIQFAKSMGINYEILDISLFSETLELTGSSINYENGNVSEIFRKFINIGANGMLILKHIDKIQKDECKNVLGEIINKKLSDIFLEMTIDLSNIWIVATSTTTKDIAPGIVAKSKVINMGEYSLDEKIKIVKEHIIPKIASEYNFSTTEFDIREEVIEMVIKEFSCDNNIRDIRNNIDEIIKNVHYKKYHCEVQSETESASAEDANFVVSSGATDANDANDADVVAKKKPKAEVKRCPKIIVSNDNIYEFFPLFNLREQKKKEYVTELSSLKEKYIVCKIYYNKEIRERIDELFSMTYSETEGDAEYALNALIILVNTLITDCKDCDVSAVREGLENTHYGLKKPKEEIVKLIMGNRYRDNGKFKAILLDGPAGIGKTTIAKSIATSLGMPYVKVSLNGISSSDVINGFARSFSNSECGIVMKGISKKDVLSYTCVMLLDEIDKMEVGAQGDPYAALHNLLDNADGFYDKYLGVTVPTDRILFIATSNNISKIPTTILDRMDVIRLNGYTNEEKSVITANYVIPKILKEYNLCDKILFSEEVIKKIVSEYSTSYGVRDVERDIENIVKGIIVDYSSKIEKFSKDRKDVNPIKVTEKMLSKYLGAKEITMDGASASVSHGYGEARALAVAGNHGTSFWIQVVENEYANSHLSVTGLPMDAIRESIGVAETVVSRILKTKIPKIHVHFTSAGVKKDGPSAGVTIFTALMSLMLKQEIGNVAFTGEIDVKGNVYAIGGEEYKLIAAEKAGVEKVFIPAENYRVLKEEGKLMDYKLTIVPIDSVDEIVRALFDLSKTMAS